MTATQQRVLLHAFSTFKLGGPQARFVQLANAFGMRYRHIVVAMDGNFEAGSRLSTDVQWEAMSLPVRRGGALANRGAFRALLKTVHPDLLLSYNWGAIEWAAANFPRLVPQVHAEDGFGPEETAHQLPRRIWTRRVLLGFAGVPVVVASRHLEKIAHGIWKLPPQRVRFIANGVAARPAEARSCRAETGSLLTIGTVAGLRPEKNVARLIRAFAAVKARQAARLVIIGDGPERGALEALARELGVAAVVEFAGYQPNPMDWLATFDLFALSSDTEQLPISMLEAMACGVPVVATRVGDVPDIMPGVATLALSAPLDLEFTATLQGAIERRADWPVWVEAGYEQLRLHYVPERMLDDWRRLFDGHWW